MRPGLVTMLEGTVALSSPKNEKRVNAATAVMAALFEDSEILRGVKFSGSIKKSPQKPTKNRGAIFKTAL